MIRHTVDRHAFASNASSFDLAWQTFQRTETDLALRKEAFHRLSLMDDDEALELMTEILEN